MTCKNSGRMRACSLLGSFALFLFALPARAAPPDKAAPAIAFRETPVTIGDTLSSIAAKAAWAAYVCYCDIGPVDQIHVYHNYSDFRVKYSSPGYFCRSAAATDNGVVFLGQNINTSKAQVAVLNLGASLKPPSFYDINVDLSQGGFIKGNYLGDYAGGSFADGRLFVHWNFMPEGQHVVYSQSASSRPVDAAYGWNSWYFANGGTDSLARIPKEGATSATSLGYSPTSLTYGMAGSLFISDRDRPRILQYNILTLALVAEFVVRAATYSLGWTPDGMLLGVQLPRTLMVLDLISRIEALYTLLAVASFFDYRVLPGRYPFAMHFDLFDSVVSRGIVRQVEILDLQVNREYASSRRAGDYGEPMPIGGRNLAAAQAPGKEVEQ